ncbi:beta-L-arabinofuranosidase domain-containing protein [Acidipila sp. EB88]|uniref:beta-L-arabinofuranosidase domain-containing protein n=1 Tax=Acidipila sp. EB88 TaxID=2305226 RepID=UPI001F3085F0|nr:beta-L-arabinofuranosidase domain-containing protein [Acidipila sp. EB88]
MSIFERRDPSRRQFLKQVGLAGVACSLPDAAPLLARAATLPGGDATPGGSGFSPGAFVALPLGAVRPKGWLQDQLRIQAGGLSGHLDETWPDVGPNSGWLGHAGESWERGPYYLDGLVPLAYLLDDKGLQQKAQRYLDWTLGSQTPSGMFGPTSNDDWWPRMVMLKVLTQYAEATGDPRVVPFMERYFRYQLSELPQRPLRDWGRFRWQDEALCVAWLYERTRNPRLLELAHLLHAQGYAWTAEFENFQYTERTTAEKVGLGPGGNGLNEKALATHGVNNGQAIKTGPVWSLFSGSAADRGAAAAMVRALDRYHGLPNGMFSCDEHLAGPNPSQGSELCTVVETMFSLETSLAIVGDPALGDRLEKLAFNALPGTLTDDMWAHQYNQQPNQVECSLHREPWTTDGPESNLFGLEPNFGCCTANYHQGWPKFTASLWMGSGKTAAAGAASLDGLDGLAGLVATAYAPCEVHTVVRGVPIHVVEETSYPFQGNVLLRVAPVTPVRFPLELRIPGWAAGTTIQVNGHAVAAPQQGTFCRIDRVWQEGDEVRMVFPMQPRISRWFHDSVAVERGPLVFSYGIGEDWLKLRDRGLTADWQVYPMTQWNYALVLDPEAPAHGITETIGATGAVPFARKDTAVTLRVPARKVPAWRAEEGVAGPVPLSPVKADGPVESVLLIPYAAAKLRITAFPVAENKG